VGIKLISSPIYIYRMPVKRARKTGGKRKTRGGALYQSGNGILASILPGPLGAIAGMVGLGQRRRRIRGGAAVDPKEYARALIGTLSPLATRDIIRALQ
jgi:hypothetical protein